MTDFEYRVIPAPKRGQKEKGVKTAEARFALGIEQELNRMATEGWEFHRAETLPSEERSGLTSTTTVFRSVLVFRRALTRAAPMAMIEDQRPAPNAPPEPQSELQPEPGPEPEPELAQTRAFAADAAQGTTVAPENGWRDAPPRG